MGDARAAVRKLTFGRWWRDHVNRSVDHRSVIAYVREEAAWSGHYAFMTMMSAGIAILGLLLSSPAVVIGAMLISPLMGPILGVGFGLALFDFEEIRPAAIGLAGGVVLAILFCALITMISPLQAVTAEIAARTRPNLFDLGVAVFSGMAGTYAMIRGRQGAIVGVAIAVAVMPPLAVVGFGLATLNIPVLAGAAFLFLTNLTAIAASTVLLARIYRFGNRLSPQQGWLQASLMFALFVAIAIPLGLALRQIAWESLATRQARDTIAARFGEQARVGQFQVDYDVRPIRVSAVVFTPELHRDAEIEARRALSTAFGQVVEVDVEQVRVGGGGDAEAAQLAAARGAAADRSAAEVIERLALVAGTTPDQVLIDRNRRVARVTAAALPGAAMAAYQQLEARVAAAEPGWTIVLIPPAAPLPELDAEDEAGTDAALGTVVWAARRLRLPLSVSGAQSEQIAERLRTQGVDVREQEPETGPVRFRWLAPDQ